MVPGPRFKEEQTQRKYLKLYLSFRLNILHNIFHFKIFYILLLPANVICMHEEVDYFNILNLFWSHEKWLNIKLVLKGQDTQKYFVRELYKIFPFWNKLLLSKL